MTSCYLEHPWLRWCAFKAKPGFRRWVGPVQEARLALCDCISMPLLACEASLLAFITLISSWPLSLTRYLNVWSLVCWGAWVSACVLEYPGILRNMVGDPDGSGQEVQMKINYRSGSRRQQQATNAQRCKLCCCSVVLSKSMATL